MGFANFHRREERNPHRNIFQAAQQASQFLQVMQLPAKSCSVADSRARFTLCQAKTFGGIGCPHTKCSRIFSSSLWES